MSGELHLLRVRLRVTETSDRSSRSGSIPLISGANDTLSSTRDLSRSRSFVEGVVDDSRSERSRSSSFSENSDLALESALFSPSASRSRSRQRVADPSSAATHVLSAGTVFGLQSRVHFSRSALAVLSSQPLSPHSSARTSLALDSAETEILHLRESSAQLKARIQILEQEKQELFDEKESLRRRFDDASRREQHYVTESEAFLHRIAELEASNLSYESTESRLRQVSEEKVLLQKRVFELDAELRKHIEKEETAASSVPSLRLQIDSLSRELDSLRSVFLLVLFIFIVYSFCC